MKKTSKIFVAGHRGLVGSAIARRLRALGYKNIVTRTRAELDLLDSKKVLAFFKRERPEYVFLAAAKVGGILANSTYPADFIRENLVVQTNVIDSAHRADVKKLLFLGSSCIYPKFAPQPIQEKSLMTGALEETNHAYAVAKIAGIFMCRAYNEQHGTDFISVMPTNLYGPNDNFDPMNSHVLPALIRRFHEAKESGSKEVVIWGTGAPKREFLHVDDLADACVFLMKNYSGSGIVNIGSGTDLPIRSLAQKIKKVVGYKGDIVWDTTKPDGTPRKLLNVKKLHALGWKHRISLDDGLKKTYAWYKENQKQLRNI